jgi:hypothetical protein
MGFRVTFLPGILLFALQIQAFVVSTDVRSAKIRMDNYYNVPACTVHAVLNQYGARAAVDLYYTETSPSFTYLDSLEIVSQLEFPMQSTIDSLILWINDKPEPARHLSIGQANATYNNMVVVTRRDPAFLRKIAPYYYSRPNVDAYELKVFPLFRDSTRHVRIYLNIPLVPDSAQRAVTIPVVNKNHYYYYGTTVVPVWLFTLDPSVAGVPSASAGTLQPVTVDGQPGYSITASTSADIQISYGSHRLSPSAGVWGYLDNTYSDTAYFALQCDLQRIFDLPSLPFAKRMAVVWVPSTSQETNAGNPFQKELGQLLAYLNTFGRDDAINLFYAGETVTQFSARMQSTTTLVLDLARQFLNNRPAVTNPAAERQYFEALKRAFTSIASADTPAIVLAMDLESSPGPKQDTLIPTRMAAELVQININKARFYAWIHPTKSYFYKKLAKALQGDLVSSLDAGDVLFQPKIQYPRISFTDPVQDVLDLNVIQANTYSNYYYYYQTAPNPVLPYQFRLMGKTVDRSIRLQVQVEVNGITLSRPITIRESGDKSRGATIHKTHTLRLADLLSQGRGSLVKYPTPLISDRPVTNWIQDNYCYPALVAMSRNKGVLTSATGLLALEPGMVLSEEDLPDRNINVNGGGGMPMPVSIQKADTVENMPGNRRVRIHPNPFNPETKITLTGLRTGEKTSLGIIDLNGRMVRQYSTLARGNTLVYVWKGTDSRGRHLPSGIYIAVVRTEQYRLQRKLVLAK